MSSEQKQALLSGYRKDLLKAIEYLEYSRQKVLALPKKSENLDPEALESWESFSARYARSADIFTSKYLRTYLSIEEPGFKGTTRDFLNKAEKLGLIDDAERWAEIRELRNMTAHEYSAEAFDFYMERLLETVPSILSLKDILER